MFTGISSHAGALVTAVVVLTGGAIVGVGPAAADSNQDEQFLALLEKEGIPAQSNVPTLVTTAHAVCRRLDGGVPVGDVVNEMRNDAFGIDPMARLYDQDRVTRTMNRFISAAVAAYCPSDQSKVASIMANPARGPNETMRRPAAYLHSAVNSASNLGQAPRALEEPIVLASLVGAVPSGEVTPPNPPQIPTPPPTAQAQIPPRPIAAPPRPKQAPPPPQQPPPPPQQAQPPAVGPQPGGAAGGGSAGTGGNGGGSIGGNGGGGPVQPQPTRPRSPGWVRLAP
jgi:Protein of unknown function (DUF732)